MSDDKRAKAHAALDMLLDALLGDVPQNDSIATPVVRKPRARAVPANVDELARQRAKQVLKKQGFA